jgi:uncharacterized protein YndB with AHSA1/START domain
MKKLVFSIDIDAPKEKVWNLMLAPESYKEWVAASWPGSFYKGNWAKGEKINFVSDDGSGTQAMIKEITPFESISAVHIAILLSGGVEDTTSELAKNWIGIEEQYIFSQTGNKTKLSVNISTQPDWAQMFEEGWPNALKKLKEICER